MEDKHVEIENKKTDLKIPKKSVKFWIFTALTSVVALVVVFALGFAVWYGQSLSPVDSGSKKIVRFEVKKGEGNSLIAKNLEKARLIRSSTAMLIYLKMKNKQASLQAGSYALSQSQSLSQIVGHIESGKTDSLKVTILPGRTLAEIKSDLKSYGYSETEVEKAFSAKYVSPLLADKPKDASLEGYIFPETFEVNAGESLSKLFERSFDTLYERMKTDRLIDKFKARDLNIHQAMTLASIIQKEASDPKDQPQIAQVFLLRLADDMKLESDVTFHYAAELLGVAPRVNLGSPYNTRLYSGLPPTPISNMNYSALKAVADPASGKYVYFIAGDDGKIYYAYTLDQHNENIEKHCKKLCGNAF